LHDPGAWSVMTSAPMPEAVRIYRALQRRAVDGDTIEVIPFTLIKIRLLGVDTPERGQPGWSEATAEATRWLNTAVGLRISTKAHDSFGRELAWVWDEGSGENLNDHMIPYGKAVSISTQLAMASRGELT
jgi:micrococcal nuclease